MIKLLKNMRRKEVLMVLLCTVLVAVQVYFDLRLPDHMTDLTTLIKTSGATANILSVGVKMLGCTLASAVLAVGLVPAALIVTQPDLGTTLMILLILGGMILIGIGLEIFISGVF